MHKKLFFLLAFHDFLFVCFKFSETRFNFCDLVYFNLNSMLHRQAVKFSCNQKKKKKLKRQVYFTIQEHVFSFFSLLLASV